MIVVQTPIKPDTLEGLATGYLEKLLTRLEVYRTLTPSSLSPSVEELARTIYTRMTSYRFCRQRPSDPKTMIATIAIAIQRQEPIPCVLGHGPLKNPNNCNASHADWAEFFAYSQLMKLASVVKILYEPGISITLYMDDARSIFANGVSAENMLRYLNSVSEMLSAFPFHPVIQGTVALSSLYPAFGHETYLLQAENNITQWLKNPENQATWQNHVLHAAKNLPLSKESPDESMLDSARKAAFRYLVCYEAEKLCGLWSQPNRIYMRYSPHPGFYQIFTLRKGSVSQPWQGKGAFLLTPQKKIDPFLITRQRAKQYLLHHIYSPRLASSDLPSLQSLPIYGSF